MPKVPAALTSPKVRKLATKALKSPSMLTTEETRALGAAVVAHLNPEAAAGTAPPAARRKSAPAPLKKVAVKNAVGKRVASKK